MSRTLVTVNVHIKDSTKFSADEFSNFVTLKVGKNVDLFFSNANQAKALMKAAMDAVEFFAEKTLPTDVMLDAGKQWIGIVYGDKEINFNSVLGWTLEDWEVVLRRSTHNLIPTQELVDEFQARFAKRGLK